jgi:hypothetical protein
MGCGYFIALAAWILLDLAHPDRATDAAASSGTRRLQPHMCGERNDHSKQHADLLDAVTESSRTKRRHILLACLPKA